MCTDVMIGDSVVIISLLCCFRFVVYISHGIVPPVHIVTCFGGRIVVGCQSFPLYIVRSTFEIHYCSGYVAMRTLYDCLKQGLWLG
ncbi:hypothetical protein F4859DRAFT_366430 [Xylaria cf. heliscus]|nr:hypothetical protein F4859DRAFT_366430 [Xylaria cf. heliscus]